MILTGKGGGGGSGGGDREFPKEKLRRRSREKYAINDFVLVNNSPNLFQGSTLTQLLFARALGARVITY